MKNIFSKINPGVLLHSVVRNSDFENGRVDVSEPGEPLQLAFLELSGGKTFRPHKHIPCEKVVNTTQESWVVIAGSVEAILYDLDDTIIAREVLKAGDASVTYRGGHNYLIMEDGTRVYEFKTGPYLGQVADKVFID